MAKVRFVAADNPWVIVGHDDPREISLEASTPTEALGDQIAARFLHPGSESELQMFEVHIPPGEVVEPHAHRTDEIIYVLGGELRVGARRLGRGASVYIPGRTLYGFVAGEDGARFLNFRAIKEVGSMSKDELLASRVRMEHPSPSPG
jgi:quercetin dioxygenase-like cupin family protein